MSIKFQITEKNCVDDDGNELQVGQVIKLPSEDIPMRYVNKGIIINPLGDKSDKELVVATPTEDADEEETAVSKQERINKRGKRRAKVQ